MNPELAIKVENISKKYIIGMRKNESFRGSLQALFNKNAYDTSREFWALKDISFEINKGDRVIIADVNKIYFDTNNHTKFKEALAELIVTNLTGKVSTGDIILFADEDWLL